MSRILYFTNDGRVVIEKTNINARYLELPDGYHPITNDSIWQDSKRMRDPVLPVFEGVLGPLGSDMIETDVKTMITEAEIIKKSHKKLNISKMWVRVLQRMGSWLYKYGLLLFVSIFIIYTIIKAFIGG